MAKIARRSVASNPSSLTSATPSSSTKLPSSLSKQFSSHSKSTLSENSHQKRSSIITTNHKNSALPATPDPLRTTNYQLTTRTILNYNRNGNPAANQSASSIPRNGSKFFDNFNANNNSSSSTNSTSSSANQNYNSTLSAADILAAERERIRMEFYATYDVMTGVRIAATLGGFFGLMVFLVVYKSRSHSDETLKVLKDPKIAAVAAACMQEEEEREIQQAIEATGLSIYPDEYENMMFRRQRMLSLGNVSAPPILHRNYRFSSIGGGAYSSLLEPGRRYSYSGGRRRSGSESSKILGAYHMGSSFGTDDYFIETDDELDNEYDALNTKDARDNSLQQQGFLGVPPTGQESRRSSAMTCCSTESSYLERRCSALNFGLMELPTTIQRRISSVSRRSSADIWDYYYPDIQIIQATPKTSPCLSERNAHDKMKNSSTPTNTYTTKSPITIPTTTTNGGVGGTTSSSSYYGQSNKIFPKSDDNYYRCHYDSFMEKSKICHTLSADSSCVNNEQQQKITTSSSSSRKYDDNNELKLIVERKISDPSSITNNNNNSYNNVYTSSYDSLQLFRNNGSDVKRAPLASLSSFKISSVDYQDSDLKSLGSDSVFVESYADTDDDMEQFSTDSDELSGSLCDDDDNDGAMRPPSFQQSSSSSSLPPPPPHLKHQTLNVASLPLQQLKTSDRSQFQKSQQQQIKNDDHKKSSSIGSSSKRIRSSLERHRTTSASSNDRILLISSPQQSFLEQPSFSSHQQTDDYEFFDRQRELPKSAYSSYTPSSTVSSSTQITRQLPSVSSRTTAGSSTLSSLQIDDVTTRGTSTGTGTTTSSCSSSHKTEIYKPSSPAVLTTPSTRNIASEIIRTSSFSYDNNDDSLNNSNRSISSSKRYYSSRHHDDDDDDRSSGRDDQSKLNTSSNNSKNECVEVNVIIENRPQTNLISPSVILELPVITVPSQADDDPPRDPSLPGTSRKWSKETLF